MIRKKTEKKVPIKGEPKAKPTIIREPKQEKEPKEEPSCSICNKKRPLAVKSKKICMVCNKKMQLEKGKQRRKIQREKKAETITQAKLDQITSKLVRTLYPPICPHCFVSLDNSNSNCGHFVSRTKQSTRFSLKNLVSVDRNCNFYRPEHVYTLGKTLNKVWGEGTADKQILLGNKHVKFSNYDRKVIYNIYLNALQKAEAQELTQDEKYELLKETQTLYEKIVDPLL